MASIIPINAVAYQAIKVPLSGHSVQLDIQQRSTGLYMNITLDGTLIMAGVICQDRTWIVRKAYFGMPGDLAFQDTQGTDDPVYSGLGSRFVLVYVEGQNVE
ncbi:hypothetical protein K2X14_11630 [Acetobacter sp. TBRC 12305]|uniref:Cyanophage baseplate Pam3 plug gp18 domain-containing protein n=1 Tax=Acetobacter garciniae TaxID=2817435 RepID=A0A939HQ08_9PROT|nr:hypothetical protein [Acetobacter garciniae]MBO1325339.1 hypothetical protein [Acetobacter garciniae]MBX0345489.1 hypothetical protein [Acetobacter garciniae]